MTCLMANTKKRINVITNTKHEEILRATEKIGDFEASLLSFMNSEYKDFMSEVNESGKFTDEIKATLKEALDKFKATQTW